MELLKGVETRLGGLPIPRMGEDLALPPEIKVG